MQNASLSAVKSWVGDYLRRRAASYELHDEAEVERMAHDLGMSTWELRVLAAKGPQAAQLLDTRMAELGLGQRDLDVAGPETTRDMQRSCALCKDHQRCREDLDAHDSSDAWTRYCPNAPTLQAMVVQRMRRSA